MTNLQWQYFNNFKEQYKSKIEEWTKEYPQLKELQKSAAKKANTPDYSFEIPVVYNKDYDLLTKEDDIKLLVIGDNPGKSEQLFCNSRYLVGQAGKLADGFFKKHEELGIDFRKNVIILNKTPVHSAKTAQLKTMIIEGGEQVKKLILESQLWMAQKTAELHINLIKAAEKEGGYSPELWLVGYSELRKKGIFEQYKNELKRVYEDSDCWDKVYVYMHFSMNCFNKDLANYMKENSENLQNSLKKLGLKHKTEVYLENLS